MYRSQDFRMVITQTQARAKKKAMCVIYRVIYMLYVIYIYIYVIYVVFPFTAHPCCGVCGCASGFVDMTRVGVRKSFQAYMHSP